MSIARDLTTGEAATMLGLSRQSIIKMFDTGQLKGYLVPLSKNRRIPRASVDKFAAANGVEVVELARKGAERA